MPGQHGHLIITNIIVNMTNLAEVGVRPVAERALYTVVTPIVCVLGVLGNLISFIVLVRMRARAMLRDRGRESTALLGMMLLAISDMAFCLVLFPRALVNFQKSLYDQKSVDVYYWAYGSALVNTFVLASTWITVILSLFRYIGICHPLRARHIVGAFNTRITYFIVILFTVALNLPSFWQHQIVNHEMEGRNYFQIDTGVFGLDKRAGKAFSWIRNIFGLVFPAFFLTFCNCSLIKALRESQRMHKRCHVLESRSQVSFRITLTLIVIVFMFILLVFPCEILDFLRDVMKMDVAQMKTFLVIRSFANVLQAISFSSNFVVYCAIGDQFREVFCDLFPSCCCCSCSCCCEGQSLQRLVSQMRCSRSTISYTHALRSRTRSTFLHFTRRSSTEPNMSAV